MQAIIDRINREKKAAEAERALAEASTVGYSVRGLWSCYADPGELSAAQAHVAMHLHLECGVNNCRVRWQPRNALAEAGRMVLDARADRAVAPRVKLFTLLRVAVFGYGALFFGGRHAVR
ncbi:hypothetical protein GFY24_35070 [Nocardia sp. SYP-A9097]|uniref:hypothetical protein n=1 Tax=Nocardia sp. SYP-A9097 TaxID=2663237 RepID=UPI00129A2072|nr:hypothetical protein [Nocardia sp. SYP-A9097]MRH92586.1 hypothetical protein [Nocardia sp. SYP-A9097]